MAKLCLVRNSPVYNDIGPYIDIITTDAHASVNSIYRGDAAAHLLHKYGKHTQRELYQLFLLGQGNPANPPGFSTHELRSDGAAYPSVLRGHTLAWWQQGFDVNDWDVKNVIAQAASHGWKVWQPYSAGSEFHHLNFRVKPRPTPHTIKRIYDLRHNLPRS